MLYSGKGAAGPFPDMETVGDEWWPWDSEEEWEVVKWLSMTGISKRAINEFLGLKYVHSVFTYMFANEIAYSDHMEQVQN